MKIWGLLMLSIALTITRTQSAAVSTTETLVVTKKDDEVSPTPSPADEATEEPNAPIKLTQMLVRSEVTMRYAHTAVVTHIRNPASKAQEATFHVLLPDTAFISGFVMTLGGKSYKAYVKEKKEAKKVFSEAVSHGAGAAHIAAKARDSNHFTVSVNVEPKSVAIFNLTYEEMLVRRNGVYNHAINLHPGALVPKLEVVVHIKESQKITTLRVPEVRTGNEIDAADNDAQNLKAIQSRNGEKEATIIFAPDLEEQMRLIGIYKEKARDSSSQESQGVLGQFVVQYDVERSNNGEILVNDGYFVHFLAPNTLHTLSKHVVFVLDTSSSMMGRKVEQLKAAMDAILTTLNPHDYFSIIEFNSDYSIHQLKEAVEAPPIYHYLMPYHKELVSPAIASPENIIKAKIIISRLQAIGGTNIYSALHAAIDLIHKFADDNKVAKNISKTNSMDIKDEEHKLVINDLEPIIIFLTDGDPTTGETSTSNIISSITEKNSGELKASLYALAFGEDADRSFLRKLALRNEGFMRHIYEAADAALQLRDFYRQVSSPLLAHVKFTYPKEQIKEETVSKNQFRMVYAGSEVVVAGELAEQTSELAPIITAFRGAEDGEWIPFEVRPKVPVGRVKEGYLPLERLWAYLSIKQLLDKRDADDQSAADESEKKALALALKYSFVTSLTSLVVVKPNETNAVDAVPADKDVPPPSTNNHQLHTYSSAHSHSRPIVHNRIGGGYRSQNYGNGKSNTNTLNIGNAMSNRNTISIGNGMRNKNAISIGNAMSNRNTISIGNARSNINTISIGNDWSNRNIVSIEDEIPNRDSISLHILGNGNRRSGGHNRILGGYRNQMSNGYMGGSDYGFDSDEDYSDESGFWNYGRPHRRYYGSTFRRPSIPSTTPVSVTTEVPDVKNYHLENYSWALGLLNKSADALMFLEDGNQVLLELSKDANVPRFSGPEDLCSNTPVITYGPAKCVYLTRCEAARNISVDDYRKSYCRVDNKYAGVCCPSEQIDVAGH